MASLRLVDTDLRTCNTVIVSRSVIPCKSSMPLSRSIHSFVVRDILKQMASVALFGDDGAFEVGVHSSAIRHRGVSNTLWPGRFGIKLGLRTHLEQRGEEKLVTSMERAFGKAFGYYYVMVSIMERALVIITIVMPKGKAHTLCTYILIQKTLIN